MQNKQKADLRKNNQIIAKFIRICDYMIMDAKVELSNANTERVCRFVSLKYTQRKVKIRSFIQKHVSKPIIWIKNKPQGINVTFHPDAGTFKKTIEDCIIAANEIVQHNQPLKKIPYFGQFFDSFENDDDFEEVEYKTPDLFKIS